MAISKCHLWMTLQSVTLMTLLFDAKIAVGDVVVTNLDFNVTIARFHSASAAFGERLPDDGLKGAAIRAVPEDGCRVIAPPPSTPQNMSWIAVIARLGHCKFEDKVRNAMLANYSAVIVYNVESNKVIQMGGDDDSLIPSVFIGRNNALTLLSHYMYYANHTKYRLILSDDDPFDINTYLLPFAIVVGICFLIMLGIVIFKCIQDHRRRMRHRLPKSALKKLPIHKFKQGDPFETCCICLDDFDEGDKLRILPCDHGYHSKCIDSWLVKHKRICPQCRKRVFDRGTGYNSSDNDSDNERAPLLGAAGGTAARPSTSSAGGTFSNQPQPGPSSRSGILDRLQAVGGSVPSNGPSTSNGATHSADSFLTVNESRRLLQHRRFRRPRRLRRVYEVLSESTTSSNSDPEDENHESDAENNHDGGPETQVENHNDQQGHNSNEISAEVHVQVHSGARNNPDREQEDTDSNDDEDESPPASRAEINSGNPGHPGYPGNHENHIVTTTDINVQQSEVSEDSSDDENEQEQTSTIIVTSRSPSNTQHSAENA